MISTFSLSFRVILNVEQIFSQILSVFIIPDDSENHIGIESEPNSKRVLASQIKVIKSADSSAWQFSGNLGQIAHGISRQMVFFNRNYYITCNKKADLKFIE